MKTLARVLFLFIAAAPAGLLWISSPAPLAKPQQASSQLSFLGFDRNIYPGDEAMKAMRRDFTFTGYWLSPPPGEKVSSWLGKREFLRSLGFGFLVLYRGREVADVGNADVARRLGEADANATSEAARAERFPAHTIIFLDIEEGGRLSPAYHVYLQSWLWTLTQRGYQGGFYCSAMPVKEDSHTTITTVGDIAQFLKSRAFAIWAFNDACPPSPGCAFPRDPPSPIRSGSSIATVWQYAQSPRRKEFAARCPPGYHADGNCYAPSDARHLWFLDVDSASTADPSNGR